MEYWEKYEIAYILVGAMAAIFSFSVILSISIFPLGLKTKIFVHMIFMISICDFLANIALSRGFPKNDEMCMIQGIEVMKAYQYVNLCKLIGLLTVRSVFRGDDQLFLQSKLVLGDFIKLPAVSRCILGETKVWFISVACWYLGLEYFTRVVTINNEKWLRRR